MFFVLLLDVCCVCSLLCYRRCVCLVLFMSLNCFVLCVLFCVLCLLCLCLFYLDLICFALCVIALCGLCLFVVSDLLLCVGVVLF